MPQNENKKDIRRIVLSVLCSFLVIALSAAIGILIGQRIPESYREMFSAFSYVLSFMPILALLIGHLLAKNFSKKKTDVSSVEMQEEFALHRQQAANDIKAVVRKIKRIYKWILIYSAVIIFVCMAATVFSCADTTYFHILLCAVFAYLAFYRLIPDKEKYDFSDYSDPAEYPVIHGIACKAAKKLGITGQIRIMLIPGDNAGIARIGKTYSLQIGTFLLDVLTEDEFEQVLIHEFAHFTVDDARMSGASKLFYRIMSKPNSEILFAYPDSVFVYEYNMYLHAASVTLESIADRAVIEHGDPRIAANALAKTACLNLFEYESERYYPEPYYAPEEKRKNSGEVFVTAFRKAFSEREKAWRNILANEIQPRNASHPILRNRLTGIGATEYSIAIPDYQGAFRQECLNARKEVDEKVYQSNLDGYAEERKRHYLEPIRTIENWKASGEPLTVEITRDIINALHLLMRFDEAEKLCDRIISEEENPFAKAYAYFVKGNMLLKRGADEGIELIYKAMELNGNFINEGLSVIGEYVCRMGMQKELDEYREKAYAFSDNELKNRQQTGLLNSSDNLTKDDMPKEMSDSILEYIKGVCEDAVAKVFLVKKIITDDFSVSAYVIKFLPETDDERINRVMNKIFEHLDTHPSGRDFSLFIYDKETEAAVKKVKDSCIYMRY